MLKRCLLAVIVALLVTSSQIAAAEDVDLDSVPHFANKAELATYIENGRRRGQTEFNFVLIYNAVNKRDELVKLSEELGNRIAPVPQSRLIIPLNDLGTPQWGSGRLTYIITIEYPGIRVANAYLSSNQQQAWMNLNHEEQDLYNIAVGIVDEANKHSSEVEKARYIYKAICDRVKYKTENERNKTAIGALIDGYANCQGYSDAFYMLGRMCGLDVRMIGGSAIDKNGQWGPHQWNWITFSDGKSYCVDVTHGIFKATYEDIKNNHLCDWEIIPNLQ